MARKSHLPLYLTLALTVLLLPRVSLSAEAGHFTYVRGNVDLLKAEATKAVPVALGDRVSVGDVVRAKRNARARIALIDDSMLNIASNSRVEIKEFFFEAEKNWWSRKFQSFRGILHFVVPSFLASKGSRFEVETPTAVAGVRGTDFFTAIRSSTITDVFVQDGMVAVRNVDPDVIGEVILGPGQSTRVRKGQPPTPARGIRPQELDLLLEQTDSEEEPTDLLGAADVAPIPDPLAGDVTPPLSEDVTPPLSEGTGGPRIGPSAGGAVPPVTPPFSETTPGTLGTSPVGVVISFP